MIIKPKSAVVAAVSGLVISLVLILTLVAYVIYVELKAKEFNMTYEGLLQKANERYHSKHAGISD